MLSKEKRFFLNVLSSYINGTKTVLPNGLDTAVLADISKSQQLDAIVSYKTHISELDSSVAFASFCALNRKSILNSIDSAFEKENIKYLVFKGCEIAKFYPNYELRTMGDSDILVLEKDKERAHRVLLSLGLENIIKANDEYAYIMNDIEFELHHKLLYKSIINDKKSIKWAESAWKYASLKKGTKHELKLEYHFVYLILHLKRHFLSHGVGFRQFLDIAVVAKQNMDWNEVLEHLNCLGLLSFAEVCFSLIEKWFDVQMPFNKELTEEFFLDATNQIFDNGVFGFCNPENSENKTINKVRKYGKLGYFIRYVFPPYKKLSGEKGYEFLKGRVYLLPIAWVIRLFSSLFNKRAKSGLNRAIQPYISPEKFDKKENNLRNWGIEK